MKVADFKTLISPKVNVPVERMRIVFSGKQLLDDKPMSEYVPESGLTVHLVARMAPPPDQAQQQPNPPPQPNPQPQQQQPTQPNPFDGIVNMVMGGFMNGQNSVPQVQVSFGSGNPFGGAGNPLASILGGLGGLIPPPPPTQPPHVHNHSHGHSHPPQQNSQSSGQQQQRISYS